MRDKIKTLTEAKAVRASAREAGRKVVFTNGCFDLLHAGHVDYLEAAAAHGDFLIVGLNSDASMRRVKGPKRPLMPQADRAAVLAGLAAVAMVVIFDEDDPAAIVAALLPDVLVKGADWAVGTIIGADTVEAAGGSVVRIPLTEGRSTTSVIELILERYSK